LSPTHLDDETLSALIDGAAGGGTDDATPPAAAATHLEGCARCARRRDELASARAALAAAPVEPLDDLARRRLVSGALAQAAVTPAGSGAQWFRRHPALVGSAAAVLLGALLAVPFVGNRHHGG